MASNVIEHPALVRSSKSPDERPATPTLSRHHSLTGDILGEDDVLIEGTLNGGVFVPQHRATISQTGSVTGAIHAEHVEISGRVEGDIRGRWVSLSTTAKVIGSVSCSRLNIADGAIVRGSIDTTAQPDD